ncbi:RNA polymerase sigma factor [Phenylobacterium sp.]|uniref:RNA polymerase sigma factor n=1 Tax=Phenylobacterium sp. TaxID=1871053 RepID=UPI002FE3FD7F
MQHRSSRIVQLAEPDPPPFDPEGAPSPAHVALDQLVRRHRGWLVAVLRLRFGRDAAEDLAQEAFLRAARQPDPAALRRPKAWLLTVALNAARDQHRRRAVRPPLTEADGGVELTDAPLAAHQDEALLLKQVILALPPHLREVFLLSRFGGLTYEEIARRLGISIKTVEWRMTKALATCAARLED